MTSIHPTSIIEDGAELEEGVVIGPYCVIGPHVRLETGVRLMSHVVVTGHTWIGKDCVIYPFASLGHPPQHLKHKGEETRLRIGANNVIREHVTMNPGTALGRNETVVGNNGYFMIGSHVAHDCIVGDEVTFANNVTLGGHVIVGNYVVMGGLSAVQQHSRIGNYAFVSGMSGITADVIPYALIERTSSLAGLNVVGMKRRGLSRDKIHELRNAYRLLFAQEGTFRERLQDVGQQFSTNFEVMEIVNFIRGASNRSIVLPRQGAGS